MKRNALVLALFLSSSATAYAAGPEVPSDAKSLADLLGAKRTEPASPRPAPAAPAPATVEPLAPITSMIGFAVGIGALLVGGAIFVKRLRSKGMFDAANQELRLEESLWVARGQRLLLVSIGERRVLIGVTGSGFESLAVLDQDVEPAVAQPAKRQAPRAEEPANRPFSQMVKDELTTAFKPSPSDRKRIIQRLNTL